MQSQSANITGISVVIPNYNGLSLLSKILPPALAALQNTDFPFEIIVVDDCSQDESVQLLKEQFPFVQCLQNETNLGFSKTANNGINAAKHNWVLLLNSDVILEKDYFKPLLKYTSRENLFGVTGRIIGWDDDKIQDAAKYPFMHGSKLKTSTDYLLTNEADMQNGIYSLYLSGADAFINKEIFQLIGGFNELFSPFYAEDTELSVRAWRMGYECLYEHNAICRHRTSSTIGKSEKKEFVRIIYNRNKMYLHAIHLQNGSLVLWWLQLVAEVLIQTLLMKFVYIKSFSQFMKHLPQVKESRKAILQKAASLVSLQDVVSKITSSLKEKGYKTFTR
ncbi:MAG: glycosyltransferase family 2 protein [Lacibacter sp.]